MKEVKILFIIRNNGFTIIESMMALLILSLVALPIFSAVQLSDKLHRQTEELYFSGLAAENLLNEIKYNKPDFLSYSTEEVNSLSDLVGGLNEDFSYNVSIYCNSDIYYFKSVQPPAESADFPEVMEYSRNVFAYDMEIREETPEVTVPYYADSFFIGVYHEGDINIINPGDAYIFVDLYEECNVSSESVGIITVRNKTEEASYSVAVAVYSKNGRLLHELHGLV